MLLCSSRLVQQIRAASGTRCSWIGAGKTVMSAASAEESRVEQDYQVAVKALNGLQTSAEELERKQDCSKDHASNLASLDEQHRLNQHYHREPKLKLQQMQEYLERSGIVDQLSDLDRLNAIHVTGTKGKGSVCAMCEAILRKHGLKTGFFSSPHLLEVRERIRLNGVPLSKQNFVKYFWQCFNELKKIEEMKMPTYFRFLTIMSFHVFLKEQVGLEYVEENLWTKDTFNLCLLLRGKAVCVVLQVDVAVVEVGIGGAYDCTNIIPHPTVCAISSLGYDHMELLGETLEKIAWQKGGICKPNSPAFTSPQFPSPMRVLAERAKELEASSLLVAPPLAEYPLKGPPLQLALAGAHQQANASLAVQACRTWLQRQGKWTQADANGDSSKNLHGVNIARPFVLTQEFREGLEQCWWPGRNQVIKKGRATYYLDGAHTPQSMKSCAEWFKAEARKEASELGKGSVVRVLLFNITKKRDPKLLMQALLDCGFRCAAFSPNIALPQGTNSADQTNLMVTVEKQCAYARANHQAWLEVNQCPEAVTMATEPLHVTLQKKWEGLPTTAPDPLSLCVGVASNGVGGVGGGKLPGSMKFEAGNAHMFTCISDVVRWCDNTDDMSCDSNHAPDASVVVASSGGTPLPPPPPELATSSHVQVLVTGSLHLVGATMSVLGCKVEDL